jgi:hypothetical protein
MQHRRSSTDPPSALSVSFQLSMHRTPSSRGEEDARTMTTTTTTTATKTTTAAASCAFDSTAAVHGTDSNNPSINGDESGYGSDSSPDGAPNEDLTDSSSGGEGGAPRTRMLPFGGQTAADSYDDDDDCDCDNDDGEEDIMRERIYFLREKQQILERAGNVLNRRAERNYAAAVASDLCHGLTTESSSSASSNSSSSGSGSEDNGEKNHLKKRTRRTGINIWVEARRVLAEMNKRAGSGGDGDDDSGAAFPVPTSVYRKRCAPTPIHPLINTGIVQRVRSKTYDSSSEAGTVPAPAGSPLASSNQVRLTDTIC